MARAGAALPGRFGVFVPDAQDQPQGAQKQDDQQQGQHRAQRRGHRLRRVDPAQGIGRLPRAALAIDPQRAGGQPQGQREAENGLQDQKEFFLHGQAPSRQYGSLF